MIFILRKIFFVSTLFFSLIVSANVYSAELTLFTSLFLVVLVVAGMVLQEVLEKLLLKQV